MNCVDPQINNTHDRPPLGYGIIATYNKGDGIFGLVMCKSIYGEIIIAHPLFFYAQIKNPSAKKNTPPLITGRLSVIFSASFLNPSHPQYPVNLAQSLSRVIRHFVRNINERVCVLPACLVDEVLDIKAVSTKE